MNTTTETIFIRAPNVLSKITGTTNQHRPKLVLASGSVRRLDLLKNINVFPEVIDPSNIEEKPFHNEMPYHFALRMAKEKAHGIAPKHPNAFVLAADTVVCRGRRILPKAENLSDAKFCLELLSGHRHKVWTAVYLISGDTKSGSRSVQTIVKFKRLTEREIFAYMESNEWQDKAGGYAIQGYASVFVSWIRGSYSNIVGLPLFETSALLEGSGYSKKFNEPASFTGSRD